MLIVHVVEILKVRHLSKKKIAADNMYPYVVCVCDISVICEIKKIFLAYALMLLMSDMFMF